MKSKLGQQQRSKRKEHKTSKPENASYAE